MKYLFCGYGFIFELMSSLLRIKSDFVGRIIFFIIIIITYLVICLKKMYIDNVIILTAYNIKKVISKILIRDKYT